MRATKFLVLAFCCFFTASAFASEAQVGVMPFAIQGKGKKTRRVLARNAAQYFSLFVETIRTSRDDVVGLNNPKETVFYSKYITAQSKKRAQAAGVSQVISGTLRGLGTKQTLTLILRRGSDGKEINRKVLKPYKRPAAQWTGDVLAAFSDDLPPPPVVEEPVVAEKAPSEPGDPVLSPVTEGEEEGSIGGPLIVTGVLLGVGALAAGLSWGWFGSQALAQSNEAVPLPKDNARRIALEENSIQNAIISDVSTALCVALALGSVVTLSMGALSE